jgi:hypothetical protein
MGFREVLHESIKVFPGIRDVDAAHLGNLLEYVFPYVTILYRGVEVNPGQREGGGGRLAWLVVSKSRMVDP